MIRLFQKKTTPGKALLRSGFGGTKVIYNGGIFALFILHRLEKIDLSIKKIEVKFSSRNPLLFKENKAAACRACFFIRVNKDPKSIVEVAQTFSSIKTYDYNFLNEIFQPIFASAVRKAVRNFEVHEAHDQPDELKKELYNYIGMDLYGYTIDEIKTTIT